MIRVLERWACVSMLGLPLCMAGCARTQGPAPMYSYEEMMHCPDWVKDEVPPEIQPYRGRYGLPETFAGRTRPIGIGTWGIDFWQANHFVAHRPETADYLYTDYTPLEVDYREGSLPGYERIVAAYGRGLAGDTEIAVTLLTQAMPALMRHPFMAPLGPACQTDRNLEDEPLLASGIGFCNEQARVFVRLCQVAGIPARLIFLFYADRKSGHVVAEFYTDDHWHMADASWFCVFPDQEGRLMSAAECHQIGAGKKIAGKAYHRRMQEIVALDDEALAGGRFEYVSDSARRKRLTANKAAELRADLGSRTADELGDALWTFGVMNYPLPERERTHAVAGRR